MQQIPASSSSLNLYRYASSDLSPWAYFWGIPWDNQAHTNFFFFNVISFAITVVSCLELWHWFLTHHVDVVCSTVDTFLVVNLSALEDGRLREEDRNFLLGDVIMILWIIYIIRWFMCLCLMFIGVVCMVIVPIVRASTVLYFRAL